MYFHYTFLAMHAAYLNWSMTAVWQDDLTHHMTESTRRAFHISQSPRTTSSCPRYSTTTYTHLYRMKRFALCLVIVGLPALLLAQPNCTRLGFGDIGPSNGDCKSSYCYNVLESYTHSRSFQDVICSGVSTPRSSAAILTSLRECRKESKINCKHFWQGNLKKWWKSTLMI